VPRPLTIQEQGQARQMLPRINVASAIGTDYATDGGEIRLLGEMEAI
jgi:hypothetical protein